MKNPQKKKNLKRIINTQFVKRGNSKKRGFSPPAPPQKKLKKQKQTGPFSLCHSGGEPCGRKKEKGKTHELRKKNKKPRLNSGAVGKKKWEKKRGNLFPYLPSKIYLGGPCGVSKWFFYSV